MNPINRFCKKMRKAKSEWDNSGGDHRSWLSYYDKKDEARCALIDAIPEASRLNLNEIINHRAPDVWSCVIEHGIERIKKGCACVDCSTHVEFPAMRCDKCAEAYRLLQQERREVAAITKRKHGKAKR